jgi:hypothetical protein
MRTNKIVFAAICICLFLSKSVMAQVQDPASPGYDFSYTADSTSVSDSQAVETTTTEEPKQLAPELRPYERVVLNIDSITNLITYSGVVEQEESGTDSLYLRAKNWAGKTFGKDIKPELDKRNQKLVYLASIPAYSYTSKYSKKLNGRYEMRLTFYIKEGRYKYQITNLVHESLKPSSGDKPTRNYFEFYNSSNVNVRIYDAVLRAADRDINSLIKSFTSAMREPKLVDEDDW